MDKNDEYQAKKKQPNRSKEALARRAKKKNARLKAKRQNNAKGMETLNKPKKEKVSKNLAVAITMEGRPATEKDRSSQMAALALGISNAPTSSNHQPIVLRDSRVVDGVILLQCADEASQQSVLKLLLGQNGIQVEAQSGDQLTSFLHNQNPGLRMGSQAIKNKETNRDNRSRPYPVTSPNTTRAGLRSPDEVFNTNPTMALYVKKEGELQPAEAVECELFMLPEQYTLSGIYPDQDGVRLEAADQTSADVLLKHLQASGWTVTASPIWPRYSVASPLSLANKFTPAEIVAGLVMRNPELPPGALRFVSSHEAEGGEGSTEGTTWRLVWVDVNPDTLEYLCSVDFLLRTVFGAIRLRETPRTKRSLKRS